MLIVPEYQSVMRGSNYKEHLDATDSFWFGKPDKVDERDIWGSQKWVFRYYERNVGVMHKTNEFFKPSECKPGRFLLDLLTENDQYYIYKRFKNGILRITKEKYLS
ncbi:hypothetical protein P4T70_23645 [Bacillus mobilis]|uniref:hypothetical protein n=1 Tax=Bacillus mobilis TaxID=2026190 RepID=UPI002E23A079|nr:hypothetical protein [Bacillus mobilis]